MAAAPFTFGSFTPQAPKTKTTPSKTTTTPFGRKAPSPIKTGAPTAPLFGQQAPPTAPKAGAFAGFGTPPAAANPAAAPAVAAPAWGAAAAAPAGGAAAPAWGAAPAAPAAGASAAAWGAPAAGTAAPSWGLAAAPAAGTAAAAANALPEGVLKAPEKFDIAWWVGGWELHTIVHTIVIRLFRRQTLDRSPPSAHQQKSPVSPPIAAAVSLAHVFSGATRTSNSRPGRTGLGSPRSTLRSVPPQNTKR